MGKSKKKGVEDENIRAIFKEIDINNDGLIDKEELRKGMLKMGQRIDDEELNSMFEVADSNKDDLISMEEFLMISQANPTTLSLKATFDEFDINKNGKITKSEMKKAFAKLGNVLTDKEVKEIYTKADLNSDGNITFTEFCKMMINTD